MILRFRMDRSVNSVDPNQTAPEKAMKRRLGSERCEVETLIAGGPVTLPSIKELCAEGRSSVPKAGEGERVRGDSPLSLAFFSMDSPRQNFTIQNIFLCDLLYLVKNVCKVS